MPLKNIFYLGSLGSHPHLHPRHLLEWKTHQIILYERSAWEHSIRPRNPRKYYILYVIYGFLGSPPSLGARDSDPSVSIDFYWILPLHSYKEPTINNGNRGPSTTSAHV